MADILEIKNVSKTYNADSDNPVKALNSVDLNVAEGEFVSIIGPSGCGKSTLFNVIGGLIDDSPPVEVSLGVHEGQALAWIYRNGRVLSRYDGPDGEVVLMARLDGQALGRFERQFPNAVVKAAAE